MHKFFIVMSGGLYGHYGKGYTLDQARAAWKKAGGKKTKTGFYREWLFTSNLPFAPMDRVADKNEADAWVGQDGSICWADCERELITDEGPKSDKSSKVAPPPKHKNG